LSKLYPVIVISAAKRDNAKTKAATLKGRTDLEQIAISALAQWRTRWTLATNLRASAPSPLDTSQGQKLLEEIRSNERAAEEAIIEYIAAEIARGERLEAIRQRLTQHMKRDDGSVTWV
jgi:hypothetical protein